MNMNEIPKDFMTVKEVLKRLRITRPTLYEFIKSGALQKYKIGKRTLLRESDVARLIKTEEQN